MQKFLLNLEIASAFSQPQEMCLNRKNANARVNHIFTFPRHYTHVLQHDMTEPILQ